MSSRLLITTAGAGNAPDLGVDKPVSNESARQFTSWDPTGGGFMAVAYIGSVPQGELYWCSGDAERVTQLQGLGKVTFSPSQISTLSDPIKNTLRAAGVLAIRRDQDGVLVGIHPPVVAAGADPLTEGLDGPPDETEISPGVPATTYSLVVIP